jgi:hypothetical protein
MGQLLEVDKKFMGTEVACLDIAPVPEGRQRSRFLVFLEKLISIDFLGGGRLG